MRWARKIVFGGMAALGLCAGCDTIDANLSLTGNSNPPISSSQRPREIMIAGSVGAVASSTKSALESIGLSAVLTNTAEGVRITSVSRKQQKFALLLARSSEGQTRLRIEWEGPPDDETGAIVLAMLATHP